MPANETEAKALQRRVESATGRELTLKPFCNGWVVAVDDLSVISHDYSYGGPVGLWEAWDRETQPDGWLALDTAVEWLTSRLAPAENGEG